MRPLRRAWASGLLLVPAVAWAHPFASRITAHQTQVALTPSEIRVDYTVETPVSPRTGPQGEAHPGTLDLESLDEIASGLLLEVGGETVPLEPDPNVPPRVRSAGQTVAMRVGLRAPAPDEEVATLRLSNANYPDLPSYFMTRVLVDPQVQVTASSLFMADPLSGVLHDEDGAWHPGDPWRTLTLTVRYRRGALAAGYRRLEGTEGILRGAWASRPRTPWGAWLHGAMQPGWLLVLTGLATLLGGTIPRASGHGFAKVLVAAGLPALLIAIGPAMLWPWFALVAALAAGGLAVRSWLGGAPVHAALAALAALALTTPHAGFAALLAIGGTIGVLVGRGRPDVPPRSRSGIATASLVLGIALLVAIRSIGSLW